MTDDLSTDDFSPMPGWVLEVFVPEEAGEGMADRIFDAAVDAVEGTQPEVRDWDVFIMGMRVADYGA